MRSDRPSPSNTGPRRLGRARLAAVATLVAAAGALVAARPAEAGHYVVTECSSQTASSEAIWLRSTPHYEERALCGTDAGLQAFHDADSTALGQWGAWVWNAPPGTVFTTVQANASLTSHAGHHGELVATRADGGEVAFGSEHADFRVHSIGGEFTSFQSRLRCVAPGPGQPCGRAGEDAAHAYVRGVYLRTEDRAAPQLTVTGGSLFDGEVVRGTGGLTFAAADVGSGVRTVYVEGNGTLLVTDVRNCAVIAGFATALSPCPATTTESAAVPTAASAFVTGPGNVVSACAEDLALDSFPNRTCEQRRVWVDNACPGSSVGGGTTLGAALGAGSATEATVASDQAGVVRGRIGGVGAGATVCALTRVLADGQPIIVGATARTGADGSYELELPPGPSREVYVHYVDGDRVVARHGLIARSTARPSLDVTPNHGVRNRDRLHFRGALPGPFCVNRVVKVQARLGKRRWQVFRTDRTDAACAFTARYRLRATAGAKRYRFRALVPQAGGYPYERGWSRTVKVKLRRRPRHHGGHHG
jgi:hypothetical protein